jgi:CheY-like chemotaxis protein
MIPILLRKRIIILEYCLQEENYRVLVVDDEKVIREILSDFLSMEGYVVRTVEDGIQALQELEQRTYNLVITDLKMPRMGGIELLDNCHYDRFRHRRNSN